VQDVRRVRRLVCQALQGAHRGGGPKKGRGEFLRLLQAQGERLCGQGHRGTVAREVGARRSIQEVSYGVGRADRRQALQTVVTLTSQAGFPFDPKNTFDWKGVAAGDLLRYGIA